MKIITKLTLGSMILIMLAACANPQGGAPVSVTESAVPADTLSPTSTYTPTPIPSVPPEQLIDDGDYALFVGDYQTAFEIFQTSLNRSSEPDAQAKWNLGSGQALYAQENYGPALDFLRLAANAEDAIITGHANFMLGKTYTRLERYGEALNAYDAYLEDRPGVLDAHVYELQGDLHKTLGSLEQAIEKYELAYQNDPDGGDDVIAEKIAQSYEELGNLDTALVLYQEIYNRTDNDYTKARMDLLIGRIYLSQDNFEEAEPYLQDAVNNYPFAYDAYTALVTLVNLEIPVNEYQRGLVNYYVGNYGLAIEAFDRYLAQGIEENADGALYYKALALRAASANNGEPDYEQSIALWEQMIRDYPTSSFYIDAWEDIEFTEWAYLSQPEQAARTSLSYVAQRPESPASPDFLFLAGRSFERANMLVDAADIWSRVADEYPDSDQTFRSIYFAGIMYVRLGDWETAQTLFARALVLSSESAEIAAAHLWIGKCQEALGDISSALDSWKLSQTADPFGHYSIRAEDLLIDRDVFTEPDTFELDSDLTPYLPEAESWLRTTFSLAPDTNLESPGLIANDPRFQRGLEYWALGNYEAGKAELEALRTAYTDDPAQTFRLIPALVNIGLYRSALIASTSLLRLAGLEAADALSAPEFFSRVRFGAYYLDWVLPIAEAEQISPLLLLSIMRQESSYEGFISSGAGARGLMQIIPATGAQLAKELNWPENYTVDDLFRPYVSLRFGAAYLQKQRNFFEGDIFAMLAAYNGGPGNTIAWKALTESNDPDLFLETIRIEETRNYIRLINETHYIYRWLYGSPMGL
jgi:soluble lytic murein transglycosylase